MNKGICIPKRLLCVFILFAVLSAGESLWTLSAGDPKWQWLLVTEVVDGDTIWVGPGRNATKVRLLGVDTPETVHPQKPVEFFGPEASEFTKRRLKGQSVRLEIEPSCQFDNHGRLLAYVFLKDGTLFNAELIKQGYARVIAPSPFHRYAEFRSYEQQARVTRLGVWSVREFAFQTPPGSSPMIIANISSKIYHLPGQTSYGRIKEENRIYFDTEEEAVKAGYRRAKK